MSTVVKWGLITGLVYVVFSLVGTISGIQTPGRGGMGAFLMNFVLMCATFYTIYMGIKEVRDEELGGYLVMGQALKTGMKIALITAIISAVYSLLYMTVIDPDMMDRTLATVEEGFDEKNMTEEQKEMAMKWTKMFMNPAITIPFIIIYIAFWGLIKSLVAGAILKKEPPPTVPPTLP